MIFKIILSSLLGLSVLTNVARIGKECKPTTPAVAVGLIIINGILIFGIWFWI